MQNTPKTEVWTGISKIASLQSSRTRAALLTTPWRVRSRSLDDCMLCVCPMWDVVFLRFAAVEQINSEYCLQRCDQGYRQPTFCLTQAHFQQPDSRLLTKSAPSTGRNFSQMLCSEVWHTKMDIQMFTSASIMVLKQKNLRCSCNDLFSILNNEPIILLHISFFCLILTKNSKPATCVIL